MSSCTPKFMVANLYILIIIAMISINFCYSDFNQCSQSTFQLFETCRLFQIPPCKTLPLHVPAICGQQWGLYLLVSMILICQCKYDQIPELQSLYLLGEGRKPQLPHMPAAGGKGRGVTLLHELCATFYHCPRDGAATLGTALGTGLIQYNHSDMILALKRYEKGNEMTSHTEKTSPEGCGRWMKCCTSTGPTRTCSHPYTKRWTW